MNATLSWLVTANVQVAVLVLALLVARRLLGHRIPAAVYCIGWLLVTARLLVPAIPHSPVSVYRVAIEAPISAPVLPLAVISPAPATAPAVQAVSPAVAESSMLGVVLWAAWLAGMAVSLLWFVRAWRHGRVVDTTPATEPALIELVRDVSRRAGLSRAPEVRITERNVSPSVVGLFRPCLVVPRSFTGRPAMEQRCVLLHECAHLRRRDLLTAAVARVATAVHWFNPFAWIALRALHQDREVACDELAMRWLEPSEHRTYGRSLITIMREVSGRQAPGAICALDPNNPLARRFRAIAAFRSRPLGHVIVAALAIGGLGFATLSAPRPDAAPHGLDLDTWFKTGLGQAECAVTRDDQVRWDGSAARRLELTAPELGRYCTFMMNPQAASYRGHRLRFTAVVRGEGVTGRGDAWIRVQAADSAPDGYGLRSGKCALSGTFDWTRCEVVVDVPREGVALQGGIGIGGAGRIWIGAAFLTPVEGDVHATSEPERFGAFDTFEDGRQMWTVIDDTEYALAFDSTIRHSGQRSGRLESRVASPARAGGVALRLSAAPYRGHHVRFVAWIRGAAITQGELWARIDGADSAEAAGAPCTFAGTFDWRVCEVAFEIPDSAQSIQLGVSSRGPGTLWLDDVSLLRR